MLRLQQVRQRTHTHTHTCALVAMSLCTHSRMSPVLARQARNHDQSKVGRGGREEERNFAVSVPLYSPHSISQSSCNNCLLTYTNQTTICHSIHIWQPRLVNAPSPPCLHEDKQDALARTQVHVAWSGDCDSTVNHAKCTRHQTQFGWLTHVHTPPLLAMSKQARLLSVEAR